MEIEYSTTKEDLINLDVRGFFDDWPVKPSDAVLRESILNADYIVLAIDIEKKKLAGYITALSDRVLAAYIPFLEVEKGYRRKGIGHALLAKMLEELRDLYMIDLVCDKDVAGFYAEAGFESWHAMIKRNYANQSGSGGEFN